MSTRELDLQKSVHDLTHEFPELIEILKENGFLGAANAVMRNTVGRVTTIPQGCQKMGKDLAEIIPALEANGFTIKKTAGVL